MAFGKRVIPPSPSPNTTQVTPHEPKRATAAPDTGRFQISAIVKATADIVDFLIASYRNQGVHTETVIGAAAALAGEFALRAVARERNMRLPEAGWVAGSDVDALIAIPPKPHAPTLLGLIMDSAKDAGMSLHKAPDPMAIIARTIEKIGGSPFPPLTVERKHYPLEWSPNACPRHRAAIQRIAKNHALNDNATATALALAIGQLIRMTSTVLDPAVSVRLSAEIMIGVSRMAPLKSEY